MEDTTTTGTNAWLSVGVPLGGFLLVVVVALALWSGQQGKVQQHKADLEQRNSAAGLPADFPSDIVPLFAAATVTSVETGQTTSSDGEPMDAWTVVAQIDSDDRKQVFDFYNDALLDQGFRQTQVISVPSHDGSGPNYAVDYGDEEMSLSITIEKKSTDEMTQLQLKVYRLQ